MIGLEVGGEYTESTMESGQIALETAPRTEDAEEGEIAREPAFDTTEPGSGLS